jgi:hypothetical protein
MDYLTPFHVGWDEFVNMLIELVWMVLPFFELSCCGGPYFSCCGWRVGCACDR